MDIKEYREKIENSEVITRDVTDAMLELDVTNSRVTQAELNQDLVSLYKRLGSRELTVECIGEKTSQEDFVKWIHDNFTDYSVRLFDESI